MGSNSSSAFLTVEEVSARLRLRPCRIREMIRQGRLRAFRPGGRRLLIDVADYEALLASCRVGAGEVAK